jgi:hypothetical protein
MCTNTGNYRHYGRDNFCSNVGNEINGSGRLGFCTLQHIGGNSNREELCRSLGGYGPNTYNGNSNDSQMVDSSGNVLFEFDFTSAGSAGTYDSNTCGYSDFDDVQYFGSNGAAGCCNGPCAIIGAGYTCTRQKTLGNPLLCCLRDMACDVQGAGGQNFGAGPDTCFETGSVYNSNTVFNDHAGHGGAPDVQQGKVCTCPASNRDQTSTTLDAGSVDSNGQTLTSYYGNSKSGGVKTAPEQPCYQLMTNFCTGTDLITGQPLRLADGTFDHTWRNNWLNSATIDANCYVQNSQPSQTFHQPCLNYLYKLMYKGTPYQCTANNSTVHGPPSAEGFQLAQQLLSSMLTKYLNEGGSLAVQEDQSGDSQMNALFWKICNDTPGLCKLALDNMCSTVTIDQLVKNISLQPWCGCHLPKSENAVYTDLYQVNPECTPTCNQQGVIPLPSEDGISGKVCSQSSCIIDNVSIQLANSKVGGTGQGISFSQLCSNCGAHGVCNCTLRNLTFVGVNAQIGSINISQQCGGNSQCYREQVSTDGTPSHVPVPCDKNINYNPYASQDIIAARSAVKGTRLKILKIALIFVILIIVLILLWVIFKPKHLSTKDVLMFLKSKPTQQDILRKQNATTAVGSQQIYASPGSTLSNNANYYEPFLDPSLRNRVNLSASNSQFLNNSSILNQSQTSSLDYLNRNGYLDNSFYVDPNSDRQLHT